MEKVKEFNVASFATILGSGGVALASLHYFPILSVVLTYALTAIFIILSVIWILKILLYPDIVNNELQHFVI